MKRFDFLDPHTGGPVLRQGPDPSAARLMAILVHGSASGVARPICSCRKDWGGGEHRIPIDARLPLA
jgi:hypothetical protein